MFAIDNPLCPGKLRASKRKAPGQLPRELRRKLRNHRTSSPPAAAAAGKVTFERPSNGKPKGGIGRTYEWFLELPVPIVLAVMWLAGAAIIGLGGLAFYLYWLSLWSVAGA